MMTVKLTFGAWLKRRRRQLDLTQKELARRVSCTEGTIRKIESNRRRPSTQLAQLIATHLELPLQQQSAFIKFARTKAYTAEMENALAAMGEASLESPPLPLLTTVWPETAPAATSSPIQHNLRPQPTPFIGRSQELDALNHLLTQPDIRIITIVGAGGIGKTRLALACAMQHITANSPFADGIFFVNLAPLSEAEHLAVALADALRLPLQGDSRSPQQQLLDYLRQKKMLLIMDNFEHLLAGVDLVTTIWQAAPHVRILVTSRERLHLQAEQVFQIEGLYFPEKGSVTTVDAYTAVQLFLQSARRNQFSFTLQESDDLNTVGHICRLADGIPLAIELTASWIDRLPLANIAAELQQGIELLAADRRDMPERHRSIRAAFAYSWQMIKKNEQAVFAQLSVFRGGFTSQAAQEITGGDLPTLSQLAHKSFLQYDQAQERYQIHELMRQFGAEKLAKNEALAVAAHDRHSDFYCRALQQWEAGLKSARQPTVRAEIEADYRNIQSAWNNALTQKNLAQLLTAVNGLGEFYKVSGRVLEGSDILQKSEANLQVDNDEPLSPATLRLFIWLSAWQVNLLRETFILVPAFLSYKQLLQSRLALLAQLNLMAVDSRKEEAFIRLQLAALLLQGIPVNWQMVQENLSSSLRLYQSLNDLTGIADSLNWYHIYARGQGLLTQAYSYIQENLVLLHQIGDPYRLVDSLLRAGIMSRVFLAFDEAVASFEQAYLTAQAAGDLVLMCQARFVAAYHAWGRGQFDPALRYLEEVLHLAQKDNNTLYMARALKDIGQTQIYRGQPHLALAQLEKVLTLLPNYPLGGVPALQLVARLHAGHYELIQLVDEIDEDALSLLGWGWFALINGNNDEALSLVGKAYRQGETLNPSEAQAQSQSLLGFALWRSGQIDEAKQELYQGLQTCLEIRCFRPLMELIPVICLVLAGEAAIECQERAVELYAMVENLPFVGNSQLFADLVGQPVQAVAATLSPFVVTAAQTRGRDLDWWATAESFLTELTELGWLAQAN